MPTYTLQKNAAIRITAIIQSSFKTVHHCGELDRAAVAHSLVAAVLAAATVLLEHSSVAAVVGMVVAPAAVRLVAHTAQCGSHAGN